jgi:hypothetical protein
VSILRNFSCWALVIVFPLSLLAADTNAAIVRSQGGVWVNGNQMPDSSAIFPGDLLETRPGSVANLNANGSTVLIQPESVVKFEGNSLTLEHGSVSVSTSTQFIVRVNCITIVPVILDWTQYDATDVTGAVQAAARKNDVNIKYGTAAPKAGGTPALRPGIVREGQQSNIEESDACGAPARPDGAGNSGLNPKWIAAGAGGGGLLILLFLHHGGTTPPPVSPSQP